MHSELGPASPPADHAIAPAAEVAVDSAGTTADVMGGAVGEPVPANADAIARLTEMVADLGRDFDTFLPHLVAALERNKAFDEISDRLRRAEESIAIRLNWALIEGVHRLLNDARMFDRLDAKVRDHFVKQLAGILRSAGVREFGRRGEEFDADRHEPVDAVGEGTRFRVTVVHASGLERAGTVLKRARVTVERYFHDEPSRQGVTNNG